MSAKTATSVGYTYYVFDGFLNITSRVLDGVLTVLLYTGGIALGAVAWYLARIQENQAGGLDATFVILVLASIFGGAISVLISSIQKEGTYWATTNLGFGCFMLVWVLLSLVMAGPYIKVADTEVQYTPQGVLYFPGSKVPRGFLSSKSHAVDLNYETTFTIHSDEKTTTGVPLSLVRTVVVHEELLPNTAAAERVKWLIGHSSGKDVKSQITQDAQDGFDAARQIIGKMEDASQIRVGMSLPSSHPWLSPVTVKEVTSSAQVVDSDKK